MAKNKPVAKKFQRSRRVTIPAGHDYIAFNSCDAPSIWLPGQPMPMQVQIAVNTAKNEAYKEGKAAGELLAKAQSQNCTAVSHDEMANKIFQQISGYAGKEQNEMLALLLNRIGEQRKHRIEGLKNEILDKQELLQSVENLLTGFNNIMNGGFDALAIR